MTTIIARIIQDQPEESLETDNIDPSVSDLEYYRLSPTELLIWVDDHWFRLDVRELDPSVARLLLPRDTP